MRVRVRVRARLRVRVRVGYHLHGQAAHEYSGVLGRGEEVLAHLRLVRARGRGRGRGRVNWREEGRQWFLYPRLVRLRGRDSDLIAIS